MIILEITYMVIRNIIIIHIKEIGILVLIKSKSCYNPIILL